jgi:hypothetical protein
MMPSRLIRPRVGFRPAMPLADEGPRIEPPVSVPRPNCAKPAAMDAPVPPEEPRGPLVRSCGLSVCPPKELKPSGPFAVEANSERLAFARMMAPASRSFFTTKASSGGMEPLSTIEPPVVGMSLVSKLSLSTTGTPCSGPRSLPALRSASSALASVSALSLSRMMELSLGPASS